MDTETLKEIIQDCHLNFLIGSGLSMPFLSTVGNTETLLTNLNDNDTLDKKQKEMIRASILGNFFESVVQKNIEITDDKSQNIERKEVLTNYENFLITLNSILLKRKSTILNKQVNLFTTNVDVFLEKALESTQLEFNDGFSGRMNPVFSTTNYRKSFFKRSLHYDNTSEVPVFNLVKVHGSLTWKLENGKVHYSNLGTIPIILEKWEAIKSSCMKYTNTTLFKELEDQVSGVTFDLSYTEFLTEYKKLAIINPTKDKFQDTLLNLNYYELLRVFSNELEKENTVLFVLGFSVADEHIREIILRAANSNPTLLILIFSYDVDSKAIIDSNLKKGNVEFKYNNLKVVLPESTHCHDFKSLNDNIFSRINTIIGN